MDETLRWALPLLASGQAQKEVTHNEAIAAIDRLLHPAVISRTLATPPLAPSPGDAYIIGTAPTGDWAGAAGQIASFAQVGWMLWLPKPGCMAWVADEQQFAVYSAIGWSAGGWPTQGLLIADRRVLAAPPVAITHPQGGTNVDLECRQALTELLVALREQNVIL